MTCSTGDSTIFATSVQYSVERTSRGSEVVKPIWLLMTMWIAPWLRKPRVCDMLRLSITTPCPEQWDRQHHAPYPEVWERILPETRDPYEIT